MPLSMFLWVSVKRALEPENEATMSDNHETAQNVVSFSKRNSPRRACLAENKPHVRVFLADMLENFGFAVRGCAGVELGNAVIETTPDLILFGALSGREELQSRLHRLKAANYRGKVLLFGGRGSLDFIESQELGERIGLRMLPPLGTPFRDSELADILSPFRSMTRPAQAGIDLDEALGEGWLELRYQPKIDVRTYSVAGAEAFVFVNHPAWGISVPDLSKCADRDKSIQFLIEFTVKRACEDWSILTAGRAGPLLSLNIPLPRLEDRSFVDWLCRQLDRPSRSGAIAVAISAAEVADNLERLLQVARALNGFGIGTLLDCVGVEIFGRLGRKDAGFAELRAAAAIANGCADDDAKRAACANLVQAARACGARATADGVKTRADFRMLCELGFDFIQGVMFAPPLEARKFMRLLRTHARVPA